MEIFTLDKQKIENIRQQWISEGIELKLDQDLLELIESFFDFILLNESYGEFKSRNNKITYIGVMTSDGKSAALVEVVPSSRGRETNLKVMSIDICPAIEVLDKTLYDEKYADILASIVAYLLSETQLPGSITKIYASNEAAQIFLDGLHEGLSESKVLDKLGITCKQEGRKWLSFKLIK